MKALKKLIVGFIAVISALALGLPANALDYKYNMSYIYFGNSSNYSKLVRNTQNSLTEVSPAYFALDSNGNLELTTAVSLNFVREMHDKGILVVPYLTNDWDRDKGLAAFANMDTLTDELADAVSAYELDGVNIDIENMTHEQREDYTAFVRLLRSKLPEGKIIAVSVAANPYGQSKGWAGSYDYAGLAAYCDYLMIMAYDESWYGSDPGPVASGPFVEKSIKYALSVVHKDKIVLGLPFYGRMWSAEGGYPYGHGVSNSMIETLIEKYDGTVQWDEKSRTACATITVKDSDPKPTINGQPLPAGTYNIWYADEKSIKSTLELVGKYDIKGTGSWSLGQEAAGVWDYYKLWLNGCTFADIQNSWAKELILSVYLKSWMNGFAPGVFSPDTPLTRAQAAAVLVRMLGLEAKEDGAYSFADCGGGWAKAYIETARKHGIIEGVGNNLFEPERPVTREEIATMLHRVMNYTDRGAQTAFSDVSEQGNPWSYDAILTLGGHGVITGYPDGSFRPGNLVTRAELAAMAARCDAARFKSY